MDSDSYLSERMLAKRWAMSHKTLQRWRIKGKGPDFLKIGKAIRYRLCDVETFEHAHFTKCGGNRHCNAILRDCDDQPKEVTPCYRTLRDALSPLKSD